MKPQSIPKSRYMVFGGALALLVIFDFINYRLTGFQGIIRWWTFWHPAWVITALILFWLTALLNKNWLWRLSFIIYFGVFIVALLNQYLPFWTVLTYNCMLFNLVFAAVYYLSA